MHVESVNTNDGLGGVMGFGSTAKKVQQMVDMADKLHARVMDIKGRVEGTQETVEETAERVSGIEAEVDEQRQILEAIAAANDVDLEQAVTDTDSEADDSND